MKTWCCVGALLLGAVILEGCAASPSQGGQVRVHTTTAAFEQSASSQGALAQRFKKPARAESPLAHACKLGSSKSCNEVGDRIAIKHAFAEAQQWYVRSCERVRDSMLPTAERLMRLSQELADNPNRTGELKSEISEIRARIQGCFDTGEMLRADAEVKQSLAYYDAVCEFSTLVAAVGEAVPGLQQVTDNACAESESGRTKLRITAQFSPQLFVNMAEQPRQVAAAKPSPAQAEEGMVFSASDL